MMLDTQVIIDYTHDDFIKGIKNIVGQIKSSGEKFDYIVGLVRGGAIPAIYLSHALKLNVVMVHWSTRDRTDWSNESNCWIPEDLVAGKKILIVDDIIDGGNTITSLLEDWKTSVRDIIPQENIKIAALHYNPNQTIKADFYDQIVDRSEDSRWVTYEWES